MNISDQQCTERLSSKQQNSRENNDTDGTINFFRRWQGCGSHLNTIQGTSCGTVNEKEASVRDKAVAPLRQWRLYDSGAFTTHVTTVSPTVSIFTTWHAARFRVFCSVGLTCCATKATAPSRTPCHPWVRCLSRERSGMRLFGRGLQKRRLKGWWMISIPT